MFLTPKAQMKSPGPEDDNFTVVTDNQPFIGVASQSRGKVGPRLLRDRNTLEVDLYAAVPRIGQREYSYHKRHRTAGPLILDRFL